MVASPDGLAVLVPGRDSLPTLCTHCGSALLSAEQPLSRHRFGRVVCDTCSRQLCWLDDPLSPARVTSSTSPSPSTSASNGTGALRPLVVRQLIVGDSFQRRPSCGLTCTAAYGHDPLVHERHGRDALTREIAARRTGQVQTGRLCVDFDLMAVTVDGSMRELTPTEYLILAYLAARVGQTCRHAEIVEAVWDAATAELWSVTKDRRHFAWHPLRTHMARVRAALGPAGAALIDTQRGLGYRLRSEPPVSLEEA